MMKVVLTGGGTGGHVYPAISIAQALTDAVPGIEILYMGSSHGPEGDLARGAGLRFVAIPSGPLTRALSPRNAASAWKLLMGVFRARGILKRFGPNVVIGTGGYTTGSIVLAQRSLGGRIVIHEQNARPGRTNLMLARFASKICVTFEASAAFLPKDKVVVTGLPIRREFRLLPSKVEARRALGLDEGTFTIVAVGGSQGAKKPNEIIAAAWPLFDDGKTQVLHQVGARSIDEMKGQPRYRVEAYIDMPPALAAADLVISRGGASTISEITAVGLPSILFPYPHAYADHQTTNAKCLVEPGAAVLCNDSSTTPEMLAGIISDLRGSPEKLAAMAKASAALGKPDAAERVAQVALSIADCGVRNAE
jgi:UDP-N-acetylglucosamine--N-acetylmuramyl-(pentapeptide) pyrophosphoryl-undecaprenol N-acetylglucosamine transferase